MVFIDLNHVLDWKDLGIKEFVMEYHRGDISRLVRNWRSAGFRVSRILKKIFRCWDNSRVFRIGYQDMTFFFWRDPIYLKIKPHFHSWIRPYKKYLLAGICLGFVSSGMTSGVPLVLRELIDKIFTQKDTRYLFVLPFAFFLLFALKGVSVFFQNYFLRVAALRMVNDVRKSLFGHLLSLPLGYFGREGTGSLMGRVTYDAERLQGGVANTFRDLIQQGFTIAGVLISMFVMSPKLTLFLLITLPLVLIPIRKTGKKLKSLSRRTQNPSGM